MLDDTQQQTLLTLARQSINHGLSHNAVLEISPGDYDKHLKQDLACFVTLTINQRLRGCIGHLIAIQPLVKDVVENAYAAAFKDSRFKPVNKDEFSDIHIEISVLSIPQKMTFTSEADLLQQIQPGIDGLILTDGFKRGTFLPSVWEQLPDKLQFWKQLKNKAGLATDHWSESLSVERYRTFAFEESH